MTLPGLEGCYLGSAIRTLLTSLWTAILLRAILGLFYPVTMSMLLVPVWPVVHEPKRGFGTVLLVYWRIDGPWLREDSAEYNQELRKLHRILNQ